MTAWIVGFVCGLFLGGTAGAIAMALFAAGRIGDE